MSYEEAVVGHVLARLVFWGCCAVAGFIMGGIVVTVIREVRSASPADTEGETMSPNRGGKDGR